MLGPNKQIDIVVAVLGVSEDISSDWEVQVLSGVFWGFVYRGTSEVRIVIGSISGFLMIQCVVLGWVVGKLDRSWFGEFLEYSV